jgi:hypothetical protein
MVSSAQAMREAIFERDSKALSLPSSSKTNSNPLLHKVSKLPTFRETLE